MRIQLLGIADKGIPNLERLHMAVIAPTNLVNYAVFDTEKTQGGKGVIPTPKNTYWFTSCDVKPGDQIVLYTKRGMPSKEARTDGYTNHFYYWNKDRTLWHGPNACAVLIEINYWVTAPI
jgi:hypothetical protein